MCQGRNAAAERGNSRMERSSRLTVGAAAATLWATSAAAAVVGADLKIYLLVWLATGIASLWALGELWLARPDHGGLAKVRGQLYQARLNEALLEEYDLNAAEDRRSRNRRTYDSFNHVA